MIHTTAILQSKVKIGNNVNIGAYTIIGDSIEDEIIIGNNSIIGHHSYIFGDIEIGTACEFDAYTRVGPKAKIGSYTRLLYGARVHYDVVMGDNCTIAGNCPDRTKFGSNVIHLGKISHSFYYPFVDWDSPEEPGPDIGSNVVIGTDANIIGPVNVGSNVFIFPREIVRKNVPPDSIVKDNKVKYMPHWQKYLKALGASNWTNKF